MWQKKDFDFGKKWKLCNFFILWQPYSTLLNLISKTAFYVFIVKYICMCLQCVIFVLLTHTHTPTTRQTYILIWHVPVRPFSIRHYFPHNNSVTPHITGWCKFAVLNGLWSCPSHWNFSALWKKKRKKVLLFPHRIFISSSIECIYNYFHQRQKQHLHDPLCLTDCRIFQGVWGSLAA